VVECLFELATCGEFEWYARGAILEELQGDGYSTAEVCVVIETALRAKAVPDVRRFAEALSAILENRASCEQYLGDPDTLCAAALMVMK